MFLSKEQKEMSHVTLWDNVSRIVNNVVRVRYRALFANNSMELVMSASFVEKRSTETNRELIQLLVSANSISEMNLVTVLQATLYFKTFFTHNSYEIVSVLLNCFTENLYVTVSNGYFWKRSNPCVSYVYCVCDIVNFTTKHTVELCWANHTNN